MPRYSALRADLVNLRAGPGGQFPVDWVYTRKGLPVEVIGQYDLWRQIRDHDGTTGWVHERMLTDNRTVLIAGAIRTLRRDPDTTAPGVARAEPGVIARLVECHASWCRVDAEGTRGWLQRSEIWGVYPDETVP